MPGPNQLSYEATENLLLTAMIKANLISVIAVDAYDSFHMQSLPIYPF